MLLCMRTTIDIPEPLFKRAKEAAARQGVTLRDLVLRALGSHLEAAPAARYVFDWKVFPGEANAAIPVDNNAALVEFLDPIERWIPPVPPAGE